MMSSKLDWTVKLGDAVLAQQSDVMDAIQRLRARADANNKLTSNKQQRVTKTQQGGRQIITIEPTDPNMIYVPYWDPAVVYGEWPYAEYPPYYWRYPGYIAGGLIAAGLAFGAGWALSNWASGGYWWGGGVNWGNAGIIANRPRVNPLGDQLATPAWRPWSRVTSRCRSAAEHMAASCGGQARCGTTSRCRTAELRATSR